MKAICLVVCILMLGAMTPGPSAQLIEKRSVTDGPPTVLPASDNVPEADTLIYINTKRILTEAVLKFAPPAELIKLRIELEKLRDSTGVDLAYIDYVIVAARFRKPTADLKFAPPEFLLLAGGHFGVEAFINFTKGVFGNAMREETYGDKSLLVFKIEPIEQEAQKYDLLKSFADMAVVSLDSTNIAIGTPNYVRAAIDAEQGQSQINQEAVKSLMRDPQVLLSIVGLPLNSFAKSLGLLGVEGETGGANCTSNFGNFYAAVTMDQSHIQLRGAMNADNPNTAKIINGLFSGLLQQALSSIPDKTVQSIVSNVVMNAEGHEVLLQADLSEKALVSFITEKMKPAEAKATTTKPAVKAPVKRRAPRRRRG